MALRREAVAVAHLRCVVYGLGQCARAALGRGRALGRGLLLLVHWQSAQTFFVSGRAALLHTVQQLRSKAGGTTHPAARGALHRAKRHAGRHQHRRQPRATFGGPAAKLDASHLGFAATR